MPGRSTPVDCGTEARARVLFLLILALSCGEAGAQATLTVVPLAGEVAYGTSSGPLFSYAGSIDWGYQWPNGIALRAGPEYKVAPIGKSASRDNTSVAVGANAGLDIPIGIFGFGTGLSVDLLISNLASPSYTLNAGPFARAFLALELTKTADLELEVKQSVMFGGDPFITASTSASVGLRLRAGG